MIVSNGDDRRQLGGCISCLFQPSINMDQRWGKKYCRSIILKFNVLQKKKWWNLVACGVRTLIINHWQIMLFTVLLRRALGFYILLRKLCTLSHHDFNLCSFYDIKRVLPFVKIICNWHLSRKQLVKMRLVWTFLA